MERHEVSDEEWGILRCTLEACPKGRGRRQQDSRRSFNGVLWILRTGAPWRDVPRRFGPWQTVYHRFNAWRKNGQLDQLLDAVKVRLSESGRIDWSLWCLDSSNVRAASAAAGQQGDQSLGRSRGGYGTKIHLVTDSSGLPLNALITGGQVHESTQFVELLDTVRIPQGVRVGRPRLRPAAVAADKAYSMKRVREWLHRRRIRPVIPQRSNQVGRRGGCRSFDSAEYAKRNVVERCVGWLKQCRRVATRYEKLAVNFLGMVKLAMLGRLLRAAQPLLVGLAG